MTTSARRALARGLWRVSNRAYFAGLHRTAKLLSTAGFAVYPHG